MNIIKFTLAIALIAIFTLGCAHKSQLKSYRSCFKYDTYNKQHLTPCKD